jgi:hypothetical protein
MQVVGVVVQRTGPNNDNIRQCTQQAHNHLILLIPAANYSTPCLTGHIVRDDTIQRLYKITNEVRKFPFSPSGYAQSSSISNCQRRWQGLYGDWLTLVQCANWLHAASFTFQITAAHGGGVAPFLLGRWERGASVRPELAHLSVSPVVDSSGVALKHTSNYVPS